MMSCPGSSEHLADPAGLEKIALHVDGQQRAMLRDEPERIKSCRNLYGQGFSSDGRRSILNTEANIMYAKANFRMPIV